MGTDSMRSRQFTAIIEREDDGFVALCPELDVASRPPYDPNDPAAVAEFWKGATVRRPGQRGPGRKPKKILLSVRYSPEVVEYFRSTGEGWQTRMDEALREWIDSRRS